MLRFSVVIWVFGMLLATRTVTAGELHELLANARAERAYLEAHPDKLRLRHNIMKVIRAFEKAQAVAPDSILAAEGLADAWALLAHWSGRSDDKAEAQQLKNKVKDLTKAKRTEQSGEKKDLVGHSSQIIETTPSVSHVVRKVSVTVQEVSGELRLIPEPGTSLRIQRKVLSARGRYGTRVFYDLQPAQAKPGELGSRQVRHSAVKTIRIGQFDANTLRIVVELVDDMPEDLVEPWNGEFIRIKANGEFGQPSHIDLASVVDDVRVMLSEGVTSPPSTKSHKKVSSRKKAISSVNQKPLPKLGGIKVVAIDPGHGGRDTGAIGINGIKEKDINLAIARLLGNKLKRILGVKVIYTRAAR